MKGCRDKIYRKEVRVCMFKNNISGVIGVTIIYGDLIFVNCIQILLPHLHLVHLHFSVSPRETWCSLYALAMCELHLASREHEY